MDYQGEIAPVNLAFDSLSYIRGQCNSLIIRWVDLGEGMILQFCFTCQVQFLSSVMIFTVLFTFSFV